MCVGVFKVLKCWLGDDKGTKQAALRLHSLHHVKRGAKPVIKRKHSFHDLEHQQLISERGYKVKKQDVAFHQCPEKWLGLHMRRFDEKTRMKLRRRVIIYFSHS